MRHALQRVHKLTAVEPSLVGQSRARAAHTAPSGSAAPITWLTERTCTIGLPQDLFSSERS